jgi:regulator of RNase E activity RraA
MEKHVLHGKIITEVKKPPMHIIEGFKKHDVCKIGDSMAGQGLMNYQIKPIAPKMRLVGTACTVLTRPGDALYVQKVIDVAKPGDVVVIDAGDIRDVACIGERLGYYMKLKGVVGIVVDGAIRDSRGLIDMDMPVFSKSVCTKIFGSVGPGAINVPIQCGGVTVNPGDIIVGDDDGVVCIPQDAAEDVLKAADAHLEQELDRLRQVEQEGKSVTEVFGLEPKLNKWL